MSSVRIIMSALALLMLAGPVTSPLMAAPTSDHLRVGVNGLPVSFGNPFRGDGRQSSYVWKAIFDPLVVLKDQGQLTALIATSWTAITPTFRRFQQRSFRLTTWDQRRHRARQLLAEAGYPKGFGLT